MNTHTPGRPFRSFYRLMNDHFGPTHWWPGDSPFEIAVGAILTQNTAWTNVERAISNLKTKELLAPDVILACRIERLHRALKPSGYFRVKTKRLRNFCRYLAKEHEGSMEKMAQRPLGELREQLLGVSGIGPETADDILLYACEKPIFVVDAYTRRILSRHGLAESTAKYEDLQSLFHRHLERDVHLFKEYHGLIVWTAKEFCKKKPQCTGCPLAPTLRDGQPLCGNE